MKTLTDLRLAIELAKAAPQTEEEMVRELAFIGCPDKEIACVMDYTVESLRKQYGAVIDAGREEGKERLRQMIAKLTPKQKEQGEREFRNLSDNATEDETLL